LGTNLEPDYFDCPYDFYQNYTQADITKAKELLGYEPQYSLEEGIKDYLKHL
jgi:ADP-glyceromanno-heptose 6-epimerase precursor (EC 5.1.3.20)